MSTKNAIPKNSKRYCLYAIRVEGHIKIGFSSSLKNRLDQYKVYNAKPATLIWVIDVGNTLREARAAELRVHKALEKYWVRGEWFSSDCWVLLR